MNFDGLSSKADHKQDLCETCLRNPHYLVLHKKTVSRLVAFLLLASFFVFVTGYFLGKKKLAEDFSHIVDQSNFSDQINFAMTSLYDKEMHNPRSKEVVAEQESETIAQTSALSETPFAQKQEPISQQKWLAQLSGGTLQEISSFVNRLAKKGITVEIRKRFGSTAKGRKIHWYQAVTQAYDNKLALQELVSRIEKLERIKVTDDTIIPIPS